MLYVAEVQTSKSVWLMVHWNIFHVGVTVSQDVTAPLPLRLSDVKAGSTGAWLLGDFVWGYSRIGCSIAKSCPKVKKNLFWSYFEIPGNSNLFAFNKFLIIILSTFGLILHISTQIVQLSCFFFYLFSILFLFLSSLVFVSLPKWKPCCSLYCLCVSLSVELYKAKIGHWPC